MPADTTTRGCGEFGVAVCYRYPRYSHDCAFRYPHASEPSLSPYRYREPAAALACNQTVAGDQVVL